MKIGTRNSLYDWLPTFLVMLLVFLSMIEVYLTSSSGTLLKYYEIAAIVVLFFLAFSRSHFLTISTPLKATILFLLYASISLLWTMDMTKGFSVLRAIGLQILFIIVASQFTFTKKQLAGIQLAMIFGGVVLAIILISSGQTYENYTYRYSISVDGTESIDPNNIGGLLAISIALLIPFRIHGPFKNLIKWVCILLMCVAMFMTSSRGAVVSLLVAVLVIILLQRGFSNRIKYISVILISILLILLFSSNSNIDFISNLVERFNDTGGSSRSDIWKSLVPAIGNNPIFGYGLGSSVEIVQEYYGTQIGSHNTFITIMVEGGLILFGTFVYMIVQLFKRLRSPEFCGIVACEVASLMCSMFIDTYNKKIFWIPLLLCFIATQVHSEEEEKEMECSQ